MRRGWIGADTDTHQKPERSARAGKKIAVKIWPKCSYKREVITMALDLSCAFATSMESHEHARIAAGLAYKRAWFYDCPALYPAVWVQLFRAAGPTRRVTLGPVVLV